MSSNEILVPGHRSNQQHVRQGNDYQNVTVAEGGRALRGNVYAENFSMNILDPSQRPQKTEQEKKDDFMRSLSFDVMDYRLATIGIAHRDTCSWLYSRAEYLKWQDPGSRAEHHGFLWIKGKPGAGKSTLMKHALQHAQDLAQRNTAIFSFFYNARGHELEKTTEGMYRSLLHQVYEALPDRLPKVLPKHSSDPSKHTWQLPILQNMLRDALLNFGNATEITCYIDALDECDEDAIRPAVDYFADLGEQAVFQGTKISICLASRPYPNITMQRYQAFNLDEQSEHHEDIKKFVRGKLRDVDNLDLELSEEVSRRSCGVFLWASLVVQILNKRMNHGADHQQLMADLEAVPTGMKELLKSILSDGSAFLLPTLLWVLFSREDVELRQLYFAIRFCAENKTFEELDWERITPEQMRLFILSSSKGLIEATSEDGIDRPQFIHESVREYLLTGGLSLLDNSLAANWSVVSHLKMAIWCRDYIESEPFWDLEGQPNEVHHLWVTAANCFYGHCEIAYKGGALQLEILDALSQRTQHRIAQLRDLGDSATILDDLLEGGHRALAEGLLRRQLMHYSNANRDQGDACAEERTVAIGGTIPHFDFNARDNSATLISAINIPWRPAVQLLLDCGADPNLAPWYDAPLLAAIRTGDCEIVELLLLRGADPSITLLTRGISTIEQTPILLAVIKGHKRDVKTLLERGADANGGSIGRGGPLTHAIRGAFIMFPTPGAGADDGPCQSEIAGMLLKHGANANGKGAERESPLTIAISKHEHEVVKMLLEHGANANGCVAELQKPLFKAILTDQQELVRLLLAHGGDPNGTIRERPLHLAVGRRDESTVRLILEAGADTKTKDEMGRGPLHVLCLGGKCPFEDSFCESSSIRKALLDAGADINAIDVTEYTALTMVAEMGSPSVEHLLVDRNFTNLTHRMALTIAAKTGDFGPARLLIKDGTDINATDSANKTALVTAVEMEDHCLVRLLLDAGADTNVTDSAHRTALIIAAEMGNFDIARLLVDRGANLDIYGQEVHYLRLLMAGKGIALGPKELGPDV